MKLIRVLLPILLASPAMAQERSHPNPQYVVDPGVPIEHARIRTKTAAPPWLQGSSLVLQRGVLDGPEEEIFGQIRDILLWRDLVHILDEQSQTIKVFGMDGRLVAEVGGPGEGPGEFRHPQAMVRLSNGKLIVSDIDRRLHVFEPSGDSLVFAETWSTSLAAIRLCAINDTLYAHALTMSEPCVIHRIVYGGEVVQSFGKIYDSGNPLADVTIGRGKLACDPVNREIAYAPDGGLGELRIFSVDGQPRRRIVFSDFKPIELKSDGNSIRFAVPEGGRDILYTLSPLPGGGFIAQYAHWGRSAREYSELFTVIIEPESGPIYGISAKLGSLMDITQSYYATVEVDVYPIVKVFAF
jgi:hypothetical protein